MGGTAIMRIPITATRRVQAALRPGWRVEMVGRKVEDLA